MTNVVVLAHDEPVQMDGAVLDALRAQFGVAGVEGVVSRAMEEIANRLCLVERCYSQQDWAALWKAAKGLVGIADQVGLSALATTARAASECARGGDAVALAAVYGRLIRLGDRALMAVWDVPEMSSS